MESLRLFLLLILVYFVRGTVIQTEFNEDYEAYCPKKHFVGYLRITKGMTKTGKDIKFSMDCQKFTEDSDSGGEVCQTKFRVAMPNGMILLDNHWKSCTCDEYLSGVKSYVEWKKNITKWNETKIVGRQRWVRFRCCYASNKIQNLSTCHYTGLRYIYAPWDTELITDPAKEPREAIQALALNDNYMNCRVCKWLIKGTHFKKLKYQINKCWGVKKRGIKEIYDRMMGWADGKCEFPEGPPFGWGPAGNSFVTETGISKRKKRLYKKQMHVCRDGNYMYAVYKYPRIGKKGKDYIFLTRCHQLTYTVCHCFWRVNCTKPDKRNKSETNETWYVAGWRSKWKPYPEYEGEDEEEEEDEIEDNIVWSNGVQQKWGPRRKSNEEEPGRPGGRVKRETSSSSRERARERLRKFRDKNRDRDRDRGRGRDRDRGRGRGRGRGKGSSRRRGKGRRRGRLIRDKDGRVIGPRRNRYREDRKDKLDSSELKWDGIQKGHRKIWLFCCKSKGLKMLFCNTTKNYTDRDTFIVINRPRYKWNAWKKPKVIDGEIMRDVDHWHINGTLILRFNICRINGSDGECWHPCYDCDDADPYGILGLCTTPNPGTQQTEATTETARTRRRTRPTRPPRPGPTSTSTTTTTTTTTTTWACTPKRQLDPGGGEVCHSESDKSTCNCDTVCGRLGEGATTICDGFGCKCESENDPVDCRSVASECSCKEKYDFSIILDESGSVNKNDPKNWGLERDFFAAFTEQFDVGDEDTRFSTTAFAKTSRTTYTFDDTQANGPLADHIQGLQYADGGATNISKALLFAEEALIKARWDDPTIPKIIVLGTDGAHNEGESGQLPPQVADRIRARGIEIFVIAIGSNVKQSDVLGIVGGDTSKLFPVGFDDMINEVERITDAIRIIEKRGICACTRQSYIGPSFDRWSECNNLCPNACAAHDFDFHQPDPKVPKEIGEVEKASCKKGDPKYPADVYSCFCIKRGVC